MGTIRSFPALVFEPPRKVCSSRFTLESSSFMAKKLDIFYAANKLTDEQYAELTEMLNEKDSAAKADQ